MCKQFNDLSSIVDFSLSYEEIKNQIVNVINHLLTITNIVCIMCGICCMFFVNTCTSWKNDSKYVYFNCEDAVIISKVLLHNISQSGIALYDYNRNKHAEIKNHNLCHRSLCE